MIGREVIAQVKEIARIEEVVGEYVTLKRKGQNEWACCPFHHEKTPSFSVAPNKGIFKCFGCGKSGDAITFIMEIEGVEYPEAIRMLAKKYGIEVQEHAPDSEQAEAQNEKEALLIVMQYAAKFYEESLYKNEEGKAIGMSYFLERGFQETTMRAFQLGYSLDRSDTFLKEALAKGYALDKLIASGMVMDKDGRQYDRFRGRVMFPIHNVAGKVIAFGARMLGQDKNQPKYLNSPETLLYHKKNILYGIFQARQAIRQQDNCYLTEGYTDVLTLHQAGVQNVVASSGTSLTEEQIRLIKRYTQNVTMLYDGDSAGIKASFRGIDLLLAEGLNVRAVSFPEGEDPDSYCRKVGPSAFQDYLKSNVQDFIGFMVSVKRADAGDDPIKRAALIGEIVQSLSLMDDSIKRTLYIKLCADKLEIGEEVLLAELNKILIRKRNEERKKPSADLPKGVAEAVTTAHDAATQAVSFSPPIDLRVGYEREIARLLITYGHMEVEQGRYLSDYFNEELSDVFFASESYARFMVLYKQKAEEAPGQDLSKRFLSEEDASIRQMAVDLLSTKYEVSALWKKYEIEVPLEQDVLPQVVMTTLIRLKWQHVRKLLEENSAHLKDIRNIAQEETVLKVQLELKKTEKELAGKLGIVVSK
jgi:DNA primase